MGSEGREGGCCLLSLLVIAAASTVRNGAPVVAHVTAGTPCGLHTPTYTPFYSPCFCGCCLPPSSPCPQAEAQSLAELFNARVQRLYPGGRPELTVAFLQCYVYQVRDGVMLVTGLRLQRRCCGCPWYRHPVLPACRGVVHALRRSHVPHATSTRSTTFGWAPHGCWWSHT